MDDEVIEHWCADCATFYYGDLMSLVDVGDGREGEIRAGLMRVMREGFLGASIQRSGHRPRDGATQFCDCCKAEASSLGTRAWKLLYEPA